MKSSYTDLPDHFTLKTYSPVPTIWFTSATQHPSIAPVDHYSLTKGMDVFKPRFKDLILE